MSLGFLLDALARVPAAASLRGRLPRRGTAVALDGLPGSSPAVLAAWLCRAHAEQLVVVLAPTAAEAERVRRLVTAAAQGVEVVDLLTIPTPDPPTKRQVLVRTRVVDINKRRARTLGILWGSGDFIGLSFFAVLFVQWVRSSMAEAKREDRRLDLLEAREARQQAQAAREQERAASRE